MTLPASLWRVASFGTACVGIMLLLSACGDGASATSHSGTVRDSAGVRIVEHDASILEIPALELPAPELELGELDGTGPEVFGRIAGVVRLSDGAVAVLDRQAAEVRVFEPDGTLRSRFGREGGGPGEFEFAYSVLRLPGDTIAVVDQGGMRAHRFLPDGTLIGHEDMARSSTRVWYVENVFADGVRMVVSRDFDRDDMPAEGRWESWMLAGRSQAGGSAPVSMARYLGSVSHVQRSGEGYSMTWIPFAPAGDVAPLGTAIVTHDGSDYTLRWSDPGGGTRQLLRVNIIPPSLTQADFDSHRDRQLADMPEQYRAGLASLYRTMPRESRLPAFGRMLSDREGVLLVSVTPRPIPPPEDEPPTSWLVVTDGGSVIGRIELSSSEVPRYMDATHLVTTRPDEMDVQHVRVYPLPVELTSAP